MKIILFTFLSLTLTTCTPVIHIFKWMEGTWETPVKKNAVRQEVWKMKDAKEMAGFGRKISGKDTTVLETIRLVFEKENFWYIPTVPDQNDAKPVPFKLTERQNQRFVFENPDHDFPKKIVYEFHPVKEDRVTPGDTLKVRVEGDMNGSEKGTDFMFLRKS